MAGPDRSLEHHDDEWRVTVHLDEESAGGSLGDRLHRLRLDNEARERLGGSVIVTRDGPHLFLYAWHEHAAREAERVVRELLEEDELAAEVELARWHAAADAWRPADEPLPETPDELADEQLRHGLAEALGHAAGGDYEWEVVIHMPILGGARDLASELSERGLPVRRRWRYVLAGALTKDDAIKLARELEADLPEDAELGVRANPDDLPHPVFVMLGSLKPGGLRDLGL